MNIKLHCVKPKSLNHEQKFGSIKSAKSAKNKSKNSALHAKLCALTRSDLLRELVLHSAFPGRPFPPEDPD